MLRRRSADDRGACRAAGRDDDDAARPASLDRIRKLGFGKYHYHDTTAALYCRRQRWGDDAYRHDDIQDDDMKVDTMRSRLFSLLISAISAPKAPRANVKRAHGRRARGYIFHFALSFDACRAPRSHRKGCFISEDAISRRYLMRATVFSAHAIYRQCRILMPCCTGLTNVDMTIYAREFSMRRHFGAGRNDDAGSTRWSPRQLANTPPR